MKRKEMVEKEKNYGGGSTKKHRIDLVLTDAINIKNVGFETYKQVLNPYKGSTPADPIDLESCPSAYYSKKGKRGGYNKKRDEYRDEKDEDGYGTGVGSDLSDLEEEREVCFVFFFFISLIDSYW